MFNKRNLAITFVILGGMVLGAGIKDAPATSPDNVMALPEGPVPEGFIIVTGLGIDTDKNLSIQDLVDLEDNGSIRWVEETVTFGGNTFTAGGYPVMDVLDALNIWYAGEMNVSSSDGSSTLITGQQVQYGFYPRADETDPENIKVLLCVSYNGKWLGNETVWAGDGPIRLVVPSSNLFSFSESDWVASVDKLEVTDYYSFYVKVDGVYVGSLSTNNITNTEGLDYVTRELLDKDQLVDIQGVTIPSIISYYGVDNVDTVKFDGSDLNSLYALDADKVIDNDGSLLATYYDGEPVSWDRGPFRLLGGGIQKWEAVKYIWGIDIVTGSGDLTTTEETTFNQSTDTSTNPTDKDESAPGFLLASTVFAGGISALIVRKRRQ